MNQKKLTAADIKRAAREFGADLVGIGSIDRWEDAPAHCNPKSIMPRAKSVICIGFRIHRGTHRGVEEGTFYTGYSFAGFHDINASVAPMVQRRLANLLEDYGYETMPLLYYSDDIAEATGAPALNAEGTEKPAPDVLVSYRIAAALCGVGQVGLNRLLLTPEFGPSQRIFLLITEAELEADPLITGLCDYCGECLKTCPANALSYSEADNDNLDIPGIALIKRCKLDITKCIMAHSHGVLSPFAPEEVKEYALNIMNGDDIHTADGKERPSHEEIIDNIVGKVGYAKNVQSQFQCPAGLCGECMRTCLAHLDKKDKLQVKFKTFFRE